ncbi:MAG: hypothetical protein WCY38_01745 [Endomicrobiia bacterium]
MFASSRQTISIMSNVPETEIYVNGLLVGQGFAVTTSVQRNKNVQIMAKANGYYPSYYNINTEMSTTGILDIIGGVCWLIPFIGLAFPGSKTLSMNNVAMNLVPDKK